MSVNHLCDGATIPQSVDHRLDGFVPAGMLLLLSCAKRFLCTRRAATPAEGRFSD